MAIINIQGGRQQIPGLPGMLSRTGINDVFTAVFAFQRSRGSFTIDISTLVPVAGNQYAVSINGVEYGVTYVQSGATATVLDLATQLVNAINVGSQYNIMNQYFAWISTAPGIITVQSRIEGLQLSPSSVVGKNITVAMIGNLSSPGGNYSMSEGLFVMHSPLVPDGVNFMNQGTFSANLQELAGIIIRAHTRYNQINLTGISQTSSPSNLNEGFGVGSTVPVLRKGTVWARAKNAVVKNTPIFLGTSTNTHGMVYGTAPAAPETTVLVPVSMIRPLNNAAAGELVELRIDLN